MPTGPGTAAPPGGPGLLTPISSKAKPKITHIKVNRKLAGPHRARLKLAFTLSKAATVTARVRVVRVKGLKRNKVVALRRISGLKGVNRIVLKQKLRGGRYMVELRAVDAQGNKSNVARRKAPFKT